MAPFRWLSTINHEQSTYAPAGSAPTLLHCASRPFSIKIIAFVKVQTVVSDSLTFAGHHDGWTWCFSQRYYFSVTGQLRTIFNFDAGLLCIICEIILRVFLSYPAQQSTSRIRGLCRVNWYYDRIAVQYESSGWEVSVTHDAHEPNQRFAHIENLLPHRLSTL